MLRMLALVPLILVLPTLPARSLAEDARPPATKGGSGSDDEPEETEVKPVAGSASPTAQGGRAITPPPVRIELKQLLGRLHPIFVHLPIGWLTLLILLELAALVRRRDQGGGLRLALLALTIASCVPAVASGLLRAGEITSQAPDAAALAALHRNLMLAVSGSSVLALAVRLGLADRRRVSGDLMGLPRVLYLAILLAAAGLLVVGAHLGGKLAFGERYLPF